MPSSKYRNLHTSLLAFGFRNMMVLRPHQLRQSFKKPKKRAQRGEGSSVAEEDAAEKEAEDESARTAGEADGRPDEVSHQFKRKGIAPNTDIGTVRKTVTEKKNSELHFHTS